MFQPVSIAKKIQESGNRLFRFVMNPCFRVRRSSPNLNFGSQVPDFSRVPNGKFVMRDCFVNSDGVQVFSNVNIIFCNDEFNVSGGSHPLTPAPTAANSLPIKSQHSKVVMRNCFANANGLQYFNNVKIIFCNHVAHSGSGSTVDFLAPTLTSPWPTPVGQSQSIKLNESSHRLCNKFSPSRSKINPCLILIILWIAVLRYLQLYASFYPFIADTILHKERRAIKTEHDELKVSKPVPGDGDGTRGSESVREHHRMIQERVSAVISNAPYLLNVDCHSFINNSKAFFEATYFSMDRKRHDRYSSRNVLLLDINVGIGCSLGGRPTIDMMPQLRKNPPKKTCNCWPKWKVKSIPRKLGNKEDTCTRKY